jgi:phosphoribosyl 1,2-cyclic phosphodiesterase
VSSVSGHIGADWKIESMSSLQVRNDVSPMTVRFWGVRGSIPCPNPFMSRYGGNTACVEIRCGEQVLIFDAGTGIRHLGNALTEERRFARIDLFLSHYHIDHLLGLPFFAPLYSAEYAVSLWGAHSEPARGVEYALRRLMSEPLLPIQLGDFRAQLEFRDFRPGETLTPRPDITIRSAPLRHPGGATGYRIDYAGRSVAYLTDTELPNGKIDPAIIALAQNTDLVILDCTYTDEELPFHLGWGHASWQQGVHLANISNTKRLCLFHHEPKHDDAFMDAVARAADAARPGTIVSYEGLRLDL